MPFNEKEAEEYDDWFDNRLGAFVDQVETDTAFKLYEPQKGEKVLDAGCGTGNFSIKLARKGVEVTGVDISEPMLEKARQKAAEEDLDIEFYNEDIQNLSFADNSFDGVFSMAAVEFIDDIEKAYQEMKRVARPGAKILIGTITRDSEWGQQYRKQAERVDSVFRDASFINPEELAKIDKDNLVDIKECLFIPPDSSEYRINWAEEQRLAEYKKGGFFVALWKIRQ